MAGGAGVEAASAGGVEGPTRCLLEAKHAPVTTSSRRQGAGGGRFEYRTCHAYCWTWALPPRLSWFRSSSDVAPRRPPAVARQRLRGLRLGALRDPLRRRRTPAPSRRRPPRRPSAIRATRRPRSCPRPALPNRRTPGPRRRRAHGHDIGRSPQDIRAIIQAHRDEARACYDAALKDHPGIQGDLVMKWTIDPKGQVTEVSVDASRSQISSRRSRAASGTSSRRSSSPQARAGSRLMRSIHSTSTRIMAPDQRHRRHLRLPRPDLPAQLRRAQSAMALTQPCIVQCWNHSPTREAIASGSASG